MDGKGAWRDSVFIERLWRWVKYEEIYLKVYVTVSEARASIGCYFGFYNKGTAMSTICSLLCSNCEVKKSKYRGLLFNALKQVTKKTPFLCPSCNSKARLHLEFPFGLGVGTAPCTVEAAFLPHRLATWNNNGTKVLFYPFLVIIKFDKHNHLGAWLPYWHIVNNENGRQKTKFGQWAPQMSTDLFTDLIVQAQNEGYLREGSKTSHACPRAPWA
jgi:hypothetical protein